MLSDNELEARLKAAPGMIWPIERIRAKEDFMDDSPQRERSLTLAESSETDVLCQGLWLERA